MPGREKNSWETEACLQNLDGQKQHLDGSEIETLVLAEAERRCVSSLVRRKTECAWEPPCRSLAVCSVLTVLMLMIEKTVYWSHHRMWVSRCPWITDTGKRPRGGRGGTGASGDSLTECPRSQGLHSWVGLMGQLSGGNSLGTLLWGKDDVRWAVPVDLWRDSLRALRAGSPPPQVCRAAAMMADVTS